MYDDVLVPTDGSDGIEAAFDHALAVASLRGATVHVLSVVDRRLYLSADRENQDSLAGTLREESESAVDRLAARAEAEGFEVVREVRDGVPDTEIVRYAEAADVDLVVIGTHGRTGREKLASMGSVSERVMKNADRPVLVVDIGDAVEPATDERDAD